MSSKPSKCVLIATVLKLSNWLTQSIMSWLSINVPQLVDSIISDSGKFLGWYLGRQAATLSFAAPIQKFVKRVHEICLGKAPAVVVMIRLLKGFCMFCHTFLSLLFLLFHFRSRL